MIRPFGVLLTFTFAVVCLGAEQESAPTLQKNEPSSRQQTLSGGNTLSDWVAQCKDKDPIMRAAAARALGQAGVEAKAAIPVLVELFKDDVDKVRWSAAEALAKIGPPAIPALTEMLDELRRNKDWSVQSAVTWALNNIGPETTIAPALTESPKAAEVPKAAASASPKNRCPVYIRVGRAHRIAGLLQRIEIKRKGVWRPGKGHHH